MKEVKISLDEAIELRQKFPAIADYKRHCSSPLAYVFDQRMGTDNLPVMEPTPKPPRPANYKMLHEHWKVVDIEKDFEGYPSDKIEWLIKEEELYFAPDL